MNDLYVTGVRPWGGPLSDVEIRDGRIAAVTAAGAAAPAGVTRLDGEGRLLVPSFSDVHVHLDSTRLGLPWRPNDSPGGVWANMLHDRAHWREAEAPMTERSTHMLGRLIAHGVTRVRGYAQVDADCKLDRLEAVVAARETHAERADVEIIAFPQAGLLREPGVPELMEAALRNGADVVGGIDPCGLDRDPVRHLDIVFGLAERFGAAVDVHLHEPGELGLFSLELIIERTRALDLRGRVTISHAFTLAHTPSPRLDEVLAEMAELDISVATVAPPGRNTLPLRRLTEAGIRVGLGDDGQRDYWSPTATRTCSTAPGSWRSPTGSATTTWWSTRWPSAPGAARR
ncbi:amidohydrolase family protein [Amycolatopsis thermalba]|uniref:Amidohydrolase family protein n=1 Tax=Amycolatopsis thermalba TaxID=944492 RepID=A0ABY4NVG0_9PSEU|nr:amidohydrolase family protein [Amycolatopsis thermalba]UQS24015.1 amidohydrolase family protein [Amycolatopsis thermalba]